MLENNCKLGLDFWEYRVYCVSKFKNLTAPIRIWKGR